MCKFGLDKSTDGSTITASPSLCAFFLVCFFDRGNTERTNSSKLSCFMFVYVCFVLHKFVSGLILQILENFGLMT